MRGPVGLVAAPTDAGALTTLDASDADGEIVVHVDPRLLAPPYLKKSRLLLTIEGHGRYWLKV
jgi:hypothetical protein